MKKLRKIWAQKIFLDNNRKDFLIYWHLEFLREKKIGCFLYKGLIIPLEAGFYHFKGAKGCSRFQTQIPPGKRILETPGLRIFGSFTF